MEFSWIDFFIGLTLVNALPHFVLGIWKGRMLSGLGFGHRANLGYSFINFGIAMGLFMYKYGWNGFVEHSLFLGAFVVVFLYFLIGPFFYQQFHQKYYQKES